MSDDVEFLNKKITQMEKRMNTVEKKVDEQCAVAEQVKLEIAKELVPFLAVSFIAEHVGLDIKQVEDLREEYEKSH